jgi:hypothetical protein
VPGSSVAHFLDELPVQLLLAVHSLVKQAVRLASRAIRVSERINVRRAVEAAEVELALRQNLVQVLKFPGRVLYDF